MGLVGTMRNKPHAKIAKVAKIGSKGTFRMGLRRHDLVNQLRVWM